MTDPFTELDDHGLKDVSKLKETVAIAKRKFMQPDNRTTEVSDEAIDLLSRAVKQLGAAVIAYRDNDVFEVPKPDEDVLALIGLVEAEPDSGPLPFTAAKFGP